jgi:hypothetical protein
MPTALSRLPQLDASRQRSDTLYWLDEEARLRYGGRTVAKTHRRAVVRSHLLWATTPPPTQQNKLLLCIRYTGKTTPCIYLHSFQSIPPCIPAVPNQLIFPPQCRVLRTDALARDQLISRSGCPFLPHSQLPNTSRLIKLDVTILCARFAWKDGRLGAGCVTETCCCDVMCCVGALFASLARMSQTPP